MLKSILNYILRIIDHLCTWNTIYNYAQDNNE